MSNKAGHVTRSRTSMPEYWVWAAMVQRCTNPNDKSFPNYGGRGVTICAEWRAFAAFHSDMGERPSDAHCLERVDNSKGYTKDNCRWATRSEQNKNTRRTKYLTIDGQTMCIKDWAALSGVRYTTVYMRIMAGEDPKRAVFDPVRSLRRR